MCGCQRAPEGPLRYALLPFDNLTGDASLDWIARAAPRIAAAEIAGTARAAATIEEAYLEKANRFIHGYFTGTAASLHLTVAVEDSTTHKMISNYEMDGPVLAAVSSLARRLEPKAGPFSTTRESAVAAWGEGDFEKAVSIDPQFGAAWLAWIDALARSGNTAGAIDTAGRALSHPVQSEIDALRIELARATLLKDPRAEREALIKLTARVADPQLLANLGTLETLTRDFAVAEGDYKKILAMEPDNAEAMNLLGYAYGFQGKVGEAAATFASYGKLPGQQPNSLDSLGEAYFMNGKFADAAKAFLEAHDLNAALVGGADLRKAAYAQWLSGDLPGADKTFDRYADFRTKMKDPAVEWERAGWEFSTGRKDRAMARLDQSPLPQAALQLRIWRGDVKLPAGLDQLRQLYLSTQPAADGLFRTLYAEALAAQGNKEEARKLAARWPLPDNAGDAVLVSLVFPKFMELRRILGL